MIFNEMILVYEGRHKSREKFLTDLLLKVSKFIIGNSFPPFTGPGQIVLREFLKNIHDHNGCWGFVIMNRLSDGRFVFQIKNSLNPRPKENEYQSKIKINFGAGLRLLKGAHPNITIETTKNLYEYIIIYTPEI